MSRRSLGVVAMLAAAFVVTATPVEAQVTVFGPELYVRDVGPPETITQTFNNPLPADEFTLYLTNGDSQQTRVTSAIVELNGERVLGPSDFNSQVEYIEVPVTLIQGDNEISVELRSSPGSFFELAISGPPPMESVISPDGGTVEFPGLVAISFFAGSFSNSALVRFSATLDEDTSEVFEFSAPSYFVAQRVPYEVRINTGAEEPQGEVEVTIWIPPAFADALEPGEEVQLLAQFLQSDGDELLDSFEFLPSAPGPEPYTLVARLARYHFTDYRTPDGSFEAVILAVAMPVSPSSAMKSGGAACSPGSFFYPLEHDPAITQVFGSRHRAMDLWAPEGTPVIAVGSGVIIQVGYQEPKKRNGCMTVGNPDHCSPCEDDLCTECNDPNHVGPSRCDFACRNPDDCRKCGSDGSLCCSSAGNFIKILLADGLQVARYYHLQEGSIEGLSVGDPVLAGQQIGDARLGNTGCSGGPHLHFEYEPWWTGLTDPWFCFEKAWATLTAAVSPSGVGHISSDPPGIDCPPIVLPCLRGFNAT